MSSVHLKKNNNSFLTSFQQRVQETPNKIAYSFLDDQNEVVESITYSELDDRSDNLGKALLYKKHQQVGGVVQLQPSDKVLLAYPPSVDFIIALLACWKCSLVAIPLAPPNPISLKKEVHRVTEVQRQQQAKAILSSVSYQEAVLQAGLHDDFFNTHSNQSSESTIQDTTSDANDDVEVWKSLRWMFTDDLIWTPPTESGPQLPYKTSNNNVDTALINYTHSSVLDTKGIRISQANVLHNVQLFVSEANVQQDSVFISWLPQHYELGLLTSYLAPLYSGSSGYYLTPMSFVKQPLRWVQAISKFRGSHSQAPNFAFALTSKTFLTTASKNADIKNGLDLSSLQYVTNASEPVDAVGMELFYAVFETFGLKKNVIRSSYTHPGHTAFVTSTDTFQLLRVDKSALEQGKVEVVDLEASKKERRSDKKEKKEGKTPKEVETLPFISCGKRSDEVDIRIVNFESKEEVTEGIVGEVWISSDSKVEAFEHAEKASHQRFQAELSSKNGSADEKTFLRTGDLGFVYNHQLYLTGHVHGQVIVQYGKRHCARAIEKTAEDVSRSVEEDEKPLKFRQDSSAAISLSILGKEVVLYFAEVDQNTANSRVFVDKKEEVQVFVALLRREVSESHHIELAFISFLPPNSLPRHASGSINRLDTKKKFEKNELPTLFQWDGLNQLEDDFVPLLTAFRHMQSKPRNTPSKKAEIDPTMLPLEVIIDRLIEIVSELTKHDVDSINGDTAPLQDFIHFDKSQFVDKLLEDFVVTLATNVLDNKSITLHEIAQCIGSGGQRPTNRPRLITGEDVFNGFKASCAHLDEESFEYRLMKKFINSIFAFGKGKQKPLAKDNARHVAIRGRDLLSDAWYNQNAMLARVPSSEGRGPFIAKFPNGIASKRMNMKLWEEFQYSFISLEIFGIFIYLPLAFYVLFRLTSWQLTLGVFLFVTYLVYGLDYKEWPPAFRTHPAVSSLMKYFSYRIIIEDELAAYRCKTAVYAFGPHGVFGIAPTIQAMINGIVLGEDFHLLAASAVFQVPFYNAFLEMLGARSVDRKSFVSTLQEGRSVGVIPGGIAEMFVVSPHREVMMLHNRKGFISIAIETGAQIVPGYCFGNTQTFHAYSNPWLENMSRKLKASIILFWGRFGTPVPFRAPILTVVGKPIVVPKVEKPSKELVEYYHEIYLRETRRIYDDFKNTYDWQDRPLVFK